MTFPLLSIITPCLNRAMFIKDAVESVLHQDSDEYEHVIMDGGSTDSTLSILAGYEHLVVFSEKDAGMYDAINKGIARSRGEIVGLLNTDDVYEPNIFSTVMDEFQTHPEADVVTGMASYFQENGEVREIIKILPVVTPENFDYALMRGVPIINAWFFRRRVLESLGQFDQSFLIAADRDLQVRCLINRTEIRPVNRVFYHYRYHQDSMTINGDSAKKEKYLLENLRLADKYVKMDVGNASLNKKFDNWRDYILFELSVTSFRRNNIRKSLEIALSAIKEKPARVFVFVVEFVLGLMRYVQGLISPKIPR